MEQAVVSLPHINGKEIPDEFSSILVSLGRSLGTVSVYGTEHPSAELIIDKTFEDLQHVLQDRKFIAIGTFNGTLTVNDQPVIARDVPVRTLEKRLAAMRVSRLALSKGLTKNELKQLLSALGTPCDMQMKEALSAAGLDHIEMTDVKYVALRSGEQSPGKGKNFPGSGTDEIASVKVSQIIAFLKGGTSGIEAAEDVKKMLSDPERLGQMILEAATIRQSGGGLHDGESLADIIVGCLRRTYGGLRKEAEFQSPQGKINLTKAMMLLEKNVLDKIHNVLGVQHPEIDRRIFDAIREMEEQQQFEMLTAHYFDQLRRLDKVEAKIIESIREQGAESARGQLKASDVPYKEWQRLMIKAGGTASGDGDLNMGALAVVLENLERLMQFEYSNPSRVKTAVSDTRDGLNTYTDQIEKRVQELETQIQLHRRHPVTVEDHARHLNREELVIEVSQLMLALLQPLTVVNVSVEAALRHAEKDIQKDLLDLAYEGGTRMQALAKRLMTLIGYPVL